MIADFEGVFRFRFIQIYFARKIRVYKADKFEPLFLSRDF